MRILFIRHGDPDYAVDGLTDKGRTEAGLLAKRIRSLGIDEVYVSPLGRALKTLEYSVDELGVEAKTLEWLQEFPALFDPSAADDATRMAYRNELKKDGTGAYQKRIIWDMLPSYYRDHPELFDACGWRSSDIARYSDAVEKYDHVTGCLDEFLSSHGYDRCGSIYTARRSNAASIAFFCHFGVTSVMLSHLWNVSPFVTLQFLAMAPTSVTEVVTEEREEGIAIFRTVRIGDITHLTMGNEKPSFSARFCECYGNADERH